MAQAISNLPIGAKVKFGKHQVGSETPWDIRWLIVAKNHTGYPSNSVTLMAEKILNMLVYDAREPNNADADRQVGGNSRYDVSNIDQWLNSPTQNWYVSKHAADTPPSVEYLSGGIPLTAYDKKGGFLSHFTVQERNAILNSTIRVGLAQIDGGGVTDIVRKVFLPSVAETLNREETGSGGRDGTQWEWFTQNPTYQSNMFEQAFQNVQYTNKPSYSYSTLGWFSRTPGPIQNSATVRMLGSGSSAIAVDANGLYGIRPSLNLSNSLKVSDTTDSEGCYTFILNFAPDKPSTITTPTIYGGKSNTISWTKATDPDGDAVTYQLECAVDGGSYTPIYKGTALSYAHLVTFNTKTITYRVKAIDTSNESSDYTTSATITVINNYAPVIKNADNTIVDMNLGIKSAGFTGTYTITDANSNAVTVTESIDGVQIRSFVATLGATVTYGVTDSTWLALPNGSHTFTIRATDGMDSSVRTYTFTKLVNSFTIQNTTPLQSTNMPTRIMMVVTRVIPSAATFKVEVCNNGYDTSPTWEDATSTVVSGRVYQFTNKTKTATKWGVKYRVTVNRNGATGACYISAIGGNFE